MSQNLLSEITQTFEIPFSGRHGYVRITQFNIMAAADLSTEPFEWRHNGRDSVSNHQPHDCLLNRLFRRRSKKTSKLRVTGLCAGNAPGTSEFPAQMASKAENVSIWWRNHDGLWYQRPQCYLMFAEYLENHRFITSIPASLNYWNACVDGAQSHI